MNIPTDAWLFIITIQLSTIIITLIKDKRR